MIETNKGTQVNFVPLNVVVLVVPTSLPMCLSISNELLPWINMGFAFHQPIIYHVNRSHRKEINIGFTMHP